MFLPWISLSWALSLNPGEQMVTEMRCYPTFPTPPAIEPKLQSVQLQILWTHPNWICVLCSGSSQSAHCLFNVPVTTVSTPVSPPSPPSHQPVHSFVKQTHPLFMAGGLLLTPSPPLPSNYSPQSKYGCCAGKLSGARPLWPFKDLLPTHTICLPAFLHLVQRLRSSSSSSWLLLENTVMEKEDLYGTSD